MLCNALKQSLGLRALSLAINRVGDPGAAALASWLAGDPASSLDAGSCFLSGCRRWDRGCQVRHCRLGA